LLSKSAAIALQQKNGVLYAVHAEKLECLKHLSRRPLVQLTHLFIHCLRLSHFPKPRKEAKVITLPNPGKEPKVTQNFRLMSLLCTKGKLFERVILKTVQRNIEERGLINASQFGFRHSTTVQCMRLTDHVTLDFNKSMSAAAAFWILKEPLIQMASWLAKLSTLQFSISLITLIGSYLSQTKFRVLIKGEISTPRDIQVGVPESSVLP
jgi:hypothetical protein